MNNEEIPLGQPSLEDTLNGEMEGAHNPLPPPMTQTTQDLIGNLLLLRGTSPAGTNPPSNTRNAVWNDTLLSNADGPSASIRGTQSPWRNPYSTSGPAIRPITSYAGDADVATATATAQVQQVPITPHAELATAQVPNTVDKWKQLAVQLKTNPDNSMFSSVEAKMIGTAQKNTKAYEKRSNSIEQRFFETLKLYGKELSTLCETEVWDDGLMNDYRFYNMLGGKKEEWKKQLLNRSLVLFVLRLENKKNPGKPLDSNTFAQMTRQLFSVFHRKGIEYGIDDFNHQGGFGAVVVEDWKSKKEEDPDFGTLSHAAQFDEDFDVKFRETIKQGKLKPFLRYEDTYQCSIYALGRYLLFRGRTEVSKAEWANMVWGTYDSGPDEGCGYCKYNMSLHKTSKMELSKPFVEKGTSDICCRENKADPNCGYKILKHFRSLCPPEQKRIFCYEMKGSLSTERRAKGSPYRANPNQPIGQNVIGSSMKQIAKICGCEKWEQFTNHANRALGITTLANADDNVAASDRLKHARHRSEQSNIRYQRQTKESMHNLQNGLIGKQVPRPSILENKPTPKEETTELKPKAKDFFIPKEDATELELKPKDFYIPKEEATELKKPTDFPETNPSNQDTQLQELQNMKERKDSYKAKWKALKSEMVERDDANQIRTTSLKRTIESLKCEASKEAKTVRRKLTKFEREIKSAHQSFEQATKTIVAQRGQLASSTRTIQMLQQRLLMLQHMAHTPAPPPQTSPCVLM
jgi:hypothetical protein